MTRRNNWEKLGEALASLNWFGPYFAPDGAIYGPDGSRLAPSSTERAGSSARTSAKANPRRPAGKLPSRERTPVFA